jgi:intracellular sulfur oxidation DsrE/DsrF family protein
MCVSQPEKSIRKSELPMPNVHRIAFALLLLLSGQSAAVWADEGAPGAGLQIEVPVPLKESKVVFNMDHPAFAGDQPIGLSQMKTIMQRYKADGVPVRIVAVFHGQAGYMMLNDTAYDKARKSEKGNPFKEQIKALQAEGLQFELCVNTARNNGWVNADLLPGVKVNGGAMLRIVQLVQDGYVQLQP